jgi:tellurium resistance protein TerZ
MQEPSTQAAPQPPVQLADIDLSRLSDVKHGVNGDGPAAGQFQVTATWGGGADIDLGALLFDKAGKYVDAIYHAQRQLYGGALTHSGEGKSGAEQLELHTKQLPATLGFIVPFLLSHSGEPLSSVVDGVLTVKVGVKSDARDEPLLGNVVPVCDHVDWSQEAARADGIMVAGNLPRITGMLVGRLFRVASTDEWCYQPYTAFMPAVRTHDALIPLAQETLQQLQPRIQVQRGLEVRVLCKGESAPLENGLDHIMIGLGWDEAKHSGAGGNIDLDASCVLWRKGRVTTQQERIYFGNRTSDCRHVQHSGDNLTGRGEGDDERISVSLAGLGVDVQQLFFTITSFRGHALAGIASMFVRVIDATTKRELMRYNVGSGGIVAPKSETGLIVCKFVRCSQQQWEMHALGKPVAGAKTCSDCLQHLA